MPSGGIQVDGTKIRDGRINQGLSLTELARRVGVSKSFISTIERGHRRPSPSVAAGIADVLGVSIQEIRL